MTGMYDAEGQYEQLPCPECGSLETVSYHYDEGFSELECSACGYRSDRQELSDLGRFRGELRESGAGELPPIPIKALKA